ncbi:uncharacterized protein G2W53_008002 [Senna tora]|uniref:Uncharacterized protein n=1 Tax=Senna tora TaxID=362788 RepID=A0A835CGG8_9FABA|nr:uncharacterized protein G2W53_008002 [Senna tora]
MWKLLILNHSANTKLSFSKNSLVSHPLPLDLASGKMIGSAEECNGLYLLGPTIFPAFHKTVLSVTCLPDILLWHYR